MNLGIKKIVTLGPSTNNERHLRIMKARGVDFVRANMSHSTIEDLKHFIYLAKKVGIPFIVDTEGSQVRTGSAIGEPIELKEGEEIKIYSSPSENDRDRFYLTPHSIVAQLEAGDILRIEFYTLILKVSDTSSINNGYVRAQVISGGMLKKNKGIAIDSALNKKYHLAPLSDKDRQSIEIGLKEGIGHIAASFIRSGDFVDEVRRATRHSMKIISKIECRDALENLDDIIKRSDYLLIDRGDLGKEIPIERIPFTQKIIINRARARRKGVIVATNLLETMVQSPKPTRAEVHDIIATITDGAMGLTLSAETAVGKYPIECINMMNRIIEHAEHNTNIRDLTSKESTLVHQLEANNYLLDFTDAYGLVPPHGGVLVNRTVKNPPDFSYISNFPKIKLNQNQLMDVEQIAIGTFSPLEGFMGQKDLRSVLDTMRLANGIAWPLPIILDVSETDAQRVIVGKDIALCDERNQIVGLLHLDEKYTFDKEEMAKKLYGTDSNEHPGVKMVRNLHSVFLGGKISLIRKRDTATKEFELTPSQVRLLFAERGWSRVVGFHTRNVIHRSHEFIQLKAMEQESCDGLFVHPVIGQKKPGDFNPKYIVQSYQTMMRDFYPKNSVVFATFSTFSRYAGPREAIFTALCRKNFGCSHFIVGRDHTGVGNFYAPTASHDIFDQFPDLGIKPVKFNQVFYSKKLSTHVHEEDDADHRPEEKLHISGTEARKILEKGEMPPSWFMRPKISQEIIAAVKRGEEVFCR